MAKLLAPNGATVTWRAAETAPARIERLLVLLPAGDVDVAELASALWMLASRSGAGIRIVAGIDTWAGEPQARLSVALLAALLRESGIEPEIEIVRDTNWAGLVLARHMPGDVIVCHAEQMAPGGAGGLSPKYAPLSHSLAKMRLPVCEISGIVHPYARNPMRELMGWALPLLVVVGSLVLEIAFVRLARDMAVWIRQLSLAIYSAIELVTIAWLARPRESR